MRTIALVMALASCKLKMSEYKWSGVPPEVTLECNADDVIRRFHCVGGGRIWLCIQAFDTNKMTCAPYGATQVEAQ